MLRGQRGVRVTPRGWLHIYQLRAVGLLPDGWLTCNRQGGRKLTMNQRANHLRNGKVVRQVRVVADNGTTMRVEALNGPLAGTQYDVSRDELDVHEATCFSQLPGHHPCDCDFRSAAWA